MRKNPGTVLSEGRVLFATITQKLSQILRNSGTVHPKRIRSTTTRLKLDSTSSHPHGCRNVEKFPHMRKSPGTVLSEGRVLFDTITQKLSQILRNAGTVHPKRIRS